MRRYERLPLIKLYHDFFTDARGKSLPIFLVLHKMQILSFDFFFGVLHKMFFSLNLSDKLITEKTSATLKEKFSPLRGREREKKKHTRIMARMYGWM